MTYMTIIVSGVISAVTGAVVAAIASFLIIKYQLKRNVQQAIDEAFQRQKERQHEEAIRAIEDMLGYSHTVLYWLNDAATAIQTADEFRRHIFHSEPIEMLHRDVWLAATKVPAKVIGAFYLAYFQFRALRNASKRSGQGPEFDSDEWLEERQTEARQVLESFRAFVDEEARAKRELIGEPDFPVHGSPTEYWPP